MAKPNTRTTIEVVNETGVPVTHLRLNHRYDDDHYDTKDWPSLAPGASVKDFEIGYWTGLGRTGENSLRVSFEADGRCWYSLRDLDAFLKGSDSGRGVKVKLVRQGDGMALEIHYSRGSKRVRLLRSGALSDNPRPVYLIAHRCNGAWTVERAITRGANAVECDLKYKGGELVVLHDLGEGEKFTDWLKAASDVARRYGEEFALIVFDLKLAASLEPAQAAPIIHRIREMARAAFETTGRPINFIFSISSYAKREALSQIINDLRPNEGVSVDEAADPVEVEKHFSAAGVANAWYGDGIAVVVPRLSKERIRENAGKAVSLRDEAKPDTDRKKAIKKVYVWTLGDEDTIRTYLKDVKVDGVFVNVRWTQSWGSHFTATARTEALRAISDVGLRLARRADSPFKVHGQPD